MFENYFGPFFALACTWVALFLIPSIPVIYFGRRRAQWQLWEVAALVLPYWSWVVCNFVDQRGKSLSNVAIELLCLAVAVPLAALLRVAIGHPRWRWIVSAVLIGALVSLAISLWAFVPWLPE
jgi:hypothetical protein